MPCTYSIMLKSLSAILLGLVGLAVGKQKCCDGVGCFNNSPPFDSMPLPNCRDVIQPSMRVYIRHLDLGQVVTRTTIPPALDETKRTVFIVHGYVNGRNTGWLHNMKNALLEKYDYNVIIVGWEGGSREPWYPTSASHTRTVGAEVALVAKLLVDNAGVKRENLWCIGHSLGAHVCGHAGQRFKLGKITGLDPAGPWFEDKDWTVGLHPGCADYVDCWHTHGKASVAMNLGTLKQLGHVDFYPNGGGIQPSCILDTLGAPPNNTISPYWDKDFTPSCSHLRVLDLFIESVTSACDFVAKMRCEDSFNIPSSCYSCEGATCSQAMDPESERYPGRGAFWFETNTTPPYCQG